MDGRPFGRDRGGPLALRRVRAAALADERTPQIAATLSAENGKTITEATLEAGRSSDLIRLSAFEGTQLYGDTLPLDANKGTGFDKIGFTVRQPVGIVVAITPFNFPSLLVLHKIGPALAAGNAVVLKPARNTPLTALALAACFVDAGLPEGVRSVLTGPGGALNDALRPVSRFFDRINRPEQLLTALPAAMRVLTDPVDTGAVVLSLPQDVQSHAFDFPAEFFAERDWVIRRPIADPDEVEAVARLLARARTPIIIAGGGVYSGATAELEELAGSAGIPVLETMADKGAVQPWWDVAPSEVSEDETVQRLRTEYEAGLSTQLWLG